MLYRDVYLQDGLVLGNAGTTIVDLDIVDPITEIDIKILAQNDNDGNDRNPIAHNVSKIEVVDGGEVIWTATGPEAIAMFRAHTGYMPQEYRTEWDNVYPFQCFPIQFGRYYGDPDYGFDPRKFRNPQLKITHNLATVRAVGAGGYVTGSGRLDVVARIIEGAPSPAKMLAVKTIHEWTGAVPGTHRIELPVDWPYRCMLLRAYEPDSSPGTNITHAKMSCDVDKFIAFDFDDDDLWRVEASQHKYIDRVSEVLVAASEFKDTGLGNCYEVNVCPNNSESFQGALIWNQTSAWCVCYNAIATPLDADKGAQLYSKGYQPEYAFLVPFGVKDRPETWFPAAQFKSVVVITTEAVASENSLALEQLRPNSPSGP